MSPSPSGGGSSVGAAGPLDPAWITAASASVLALALGLAVVIFVVWKPPTGWIQYFVYAATLGIAALAMGLTIYQATKPTPAVLRDCYSTVDQLKAYVEAKILFVGSAEEAKNLGAQMQEVIAHSTCRPS
jgi:hypothetical protein